MRFFRGPRSGSGNTYDGGSWIFVDVQFDQEVKRIYSRQDGNTRLALEIGDKTVQMTPTAGGGHAIDCSNAEGGTVRCATVWTTLRFEYQVQADDVDADGVSILSGALTLDGVTVRDRATNSIDASLGLGSHTIINDVMHKVAGNVNLQPRVSSVELEGPQAAPPAGGYKTGDTISIYVGFDENITLSGGNPSLALKVGSQTRQAAFDSVSRPAGAASDAPYSTPQTLSLIHI